MFIISVLVLANLRNNALNLAKILENTPYKLLY